MDIGKNINAIGEYNFYSKNVTEFITTISSKFKVNLQVYFNDFTSKNSSFERADEFFDFKYNETFTLSVYYYEYDEKKVAAKNIYCTYELNIPVNLKTENELNLVFYHNGLFELAFIPFNNGWRIYKEDIKGINLNLHTSSNDVIDAIKLIRSCYITIIKKIDCNEVIICRNAHYNAADEFLYTSKSNPINSVNEIKDVLKKLDNVALYNFRESSLQTNQFESNKDVDVAFIDKFDY